VSYHHSGKQFLTVTLDLGIDGMRIDTHYHIPTDETIHFKLILGDTSIWSRGRVVQSELLPGNRTVSQIEFTSISDENLTALREYLMWAEKWPKPRPMMFVGDIKDPELDVVDE
jgi:hypothetical protein